MITVHQVRREVNCALKRLLSITVLIVLLVVVANAYTIVMRDGRRLEIPSRFVVTASTLTYEVQPGIQVTLQMSTIDVAATEKANNEPTGALLRKGQLQSEASDISKMRTSSVRKTITNRELESAARRRVASEQAYAKRAQELGLPSLAQARKDADAASVAAQMELRERLAGERQSEEYWRARATELRTEMSALDAEVRYVRARLDEFPNPNWSGFTTTTSIVPFISFGNVGRGSFGNGGLGRGFPGRRGQRPGVFAAPRGIGPQLSGRVGFGGGATRGRVFINPVGRAPFGHRSHVGGLGGAHLPLSGGAGILPVFSSSSAYDYSYERSELITRFNDLAAARAGLNARWRELEEEARRAGVPPGWLRR